MEKSNIWILVLSVIVAISAIVTVIGMVLFPFPNEQQDASFDELSNLQEQILNPFNLLILPLAAWTLQIGWLALFIILPLFAKRKGMNMVLWGAFAFFLAPIAGFVFVFKK